LLAPAKETKVAKNLEPQRPGRPQNKTETETGEETISSSTDQLDGSSNKSIALRLGRCAFAALHSKNPAIAYTAEISRLQLGGCDVGHKYHDANTLEALSFASVKLCREALRQSMRQPPLNLSRFGLRSCFSASLDGVTLPNGHTVLPTVVHFTDAKGQLQWAMAGSEIHGVDYSGRSTAKLFLKSLAFLAPSEKSPEWSQFWDHLICVCGDGAMVGNTGISVDLHIAEVLKLQYRSGMQDAFHEFDLVGRPLMTELLEVPLLPVLAPHAPLLDPAVPKPEHAYLPLPAWFRSMAQDCPRLPAQAWGFGAGMNEGLLEQRGMKRGADTEDLVCFLHCFVR